MSQFYVFEIRFWPNSNNFNSSHNFDFFWKNKAFYLKILTLPCKFDFLSQHYDFERKNFDFLSEFFYFVSKNV